jgi:hypothetical protein
MHIAAAAATAVANRIKLPALPLSASSVVHAKNHKQDKKLNTHDHINMQLLRAEVHAQLTPDFEFASGLAINRGAACCKF